MKNRIEKGTEEWQLLNDFWKYHQDYYNPYTDEEWELLVTESEKLYQKYAKTALGAFAKDLILTHMSECERKFKLRTGRINKQM